MFSFPTQSSFDYQHYKETGEKRIHRNLHASERVVQTKLKPPSTGIPTSTVYKFRLARAPARKLAKLIKEKNYITKYFSYEAYFD